MTETCPSFLFLCSTGRAGSTLTMRVLCGHRSILARDRFPYETRFRQYVEAARLNGREQLSFLAESNGAVEYLPFHGADSESLEWQRHVAPRAAASVATALDYYRFVAERQGKTDYRWIVEKAIGVELVSQLLARDPASRALFLFRDPRDTYYSMKAFNRKVDYSSGFGEHLGDEAMFRSIVFSWRRFAKLKAQYPDRLYRANYEPLSAGRASYYQRLFAWLGVEHDLAYLRPVVRRGLERDASTRQHSTTDSAQTSIGRWRSEAGAQDLELFRRFDKDIVAMGYDV